MTHPCPACHEPVKTYLKECTNCGEALVPAVSAVGNQGSPEETGRIRRGLLAILLAGSYYYFASGYSAWEFPYEVSAAVNETLALVLLLSGLSLVLLELFQSVAPGWAGSRN